MRKTIANLMIALAMANLAISCAEDDFVADANGDVFIISKIIGTGTDADTLYGLALHAFGNKDFSKVTATSPANAVTDLVPYNGSTYDYYYETAEDEFTATLPDQGNYSFSFKFITAEEDTDVDKLTDGVLFPAKINRCEYDVTNSRIKIEWDVVKDADYIVVSLKDPAGKLVYISTNLAGSKVSHEIAENTTIWYDAPDDGVTYTVIVSAFMYESVAVSMNVQAKSIATATVIWGGAN
jgi:hypothetical protein